MSKVWLIRSRHTYLWKVWKVQKALRKESQKVLFSLWEHQLKPQLDSETKDNGGQRQREEMERTRALIKLIRTTDQINPKTLPGISLSFHFLLFLSVPLLPPSSGPPPLLFSRAPSLSVLECGWLDLYAGNGNCCELVSQCSSYTQKTLGCSLTPIPSSLSPLTSHILPLHFIF